jgi:RNA recognition motif-containing protein
MNIYVGNLSYETTDEKLREAFEAFGEVSSVNIITDRFTGDPRGFAFVEMTDSGQASAAIEGLNEQELDGRTLKVSEARPRQENRDRGGRGGYGGGGGRRRNW